MNGKRQTARVSISLNKPVGYVSCQLEKAYRAAASPITSANQYQMAFFFLPFERLRGLATAGRLDIDSQGSLILTQDGRRAQTLVGANSDVEGGYLARVWGKADS